MLTGLPQYSDSDFESQLQSPNQQTIISALNEYLEEEEGITISYMHIDNDGWKFIQVFESLKLEEGVRGYQESDVKVSIKFEELLDIFNQLKQQLNSDVDLNKFPIKLQFTNPYPLLTKSASLNESIIQVKALYVVLFALIADLSKYELDINPTNIMGKTVVSVTILPNLL